MSNPGKTVRLFLADGTPGGLLTAEIMNWTGHVIAAPRSDLAALLNRRESSRTGIYILLGDDPASVGGSRAYIGEADDISKRLYQHSRTEVQGGKDFWDRAIVLTSKDANLTKAHARYLESRIIELAHQATRTQLVNGTAPPLLPLPEADQSDMEYFISQARIVLPVVGVHILRAAGPQSLPAVNSLEPRAPAAAMNSPVFEMRNLQNGTVARAQEIDGEFTVLKDSTARVKWPGAPHAYESFREKLRQDGTLVASSEGNTLVFMHDQVFASPSAAAAVVAGRSANGRKEWKLANGNANYGEWQNQNIETSLTSGDLL